MIYDLKHPLVNLEILKHNQDNMFWVLNEMNEDTNNLINMLYFNSFILKNLNNSSHILTLKNIYKIYLLPTIGIITPIVYFILPYLVIRFKFGVQFSFTSFIKFIYNYYVNLNFGNMFANSKLNMIRKVWMLFSILFYFNSIFNSIELSKLTHKINILICNHINSISKYISQYKHYGHLDSDISETEGVQGFAMLVNKKKIMRFGMFDENIFLYAEELDLCKRLRLNNEKIFINKTAKVFHLAAKSTNIGFEFDKCRNWHWGWSKVYFEKKYFNVFLVYLKFSTLLFIQLLKIIFYIALLNKKEVINKSMRFSGVLNSLLGISSWYRPKFNFD